jgi:hypothetical protein
MSVLIGRHEEGITLNALEYLLDAPNGKVLEFDTKDQAKDYLRQQGIKDEDDLEDCFVYYDDVSKGNL